MFLVLQNFLQHEAGWLHPGSAAECDLCVPISGEEASSGTGWTFWQEYRGQWHDLSLGMHVSAFLLCDDYCLYPLIHRWL